MKLLSRVGLVVAWLVTGSLVTTAALFPTVAIAREDGDGYDESGYDEGGGDEGGGDEGGGDEGGYDEGGGDEGGGDGE